MMYLITKHDGLPLKELAQLKIPKFIHFSITSLGGTKYEPGVMKMDDMLDRIKALIDDGTLNPNLITIRIDPIIPGVTTSKDIEHIVQRAKSMGINQFKFSIMDSYGYTSTGERTQNNRFIIQKMEDLGYNWDTYYGRDRNGVVNFDAKPEYLTQIYKFMDDLADRYKIQFNTCGEKPVDIEGLSHIRFSMGCVNVQTMNAVMGTTDIAHVEGQQRTHCSCFGNICDALRYDDYCASSCVYCYAKHNKDKHVQYYNKDGTLKNNRFTRTSEQNNNTLSSYRSGIKEKNPILEESQKPVGPETKMNIWWGKGPQDPQHENGDLSNFAVRPFKFAPVDYRYGDNRNETEFTSVEQAFHYYKMLILEQAADSLNYPTTTAGIQDLRKTKTTNRNAILNIADSILKTKTASSARSIGKQPIPLVPYKVTLHTPEGKEYVKTVVTEQEIKDAIFKVYDTKSSALMKDLIKASFEQNPQALQRLLATGNATLTHTQDRGKWGTEFSKILMEVRDELRRE